MRHQLGAGVLDMAERDNETLMLTSDRFERRLTEETGKLRVDMSSGFGSVRTEMADRNAELLKWLLVFFAAQTAAQTAALAALLSMFK
jgi:hypothetical protein